MRVIAGSAKRRTLVTPSGNGTRPTTDRIKETLFNVLQNELSGIRFLDLFSGSGGIGIEALSRGAAHAVFVEKSGEAVRCIKKNLEHTGFQKKSRVIAKDVLAALRLLDGVEEAFDIVFLDPPYEKGLEDKVIPFLVESSVVREGTLIILETSLQLAKAEKNRDGLLLERSKCYKTNGHLFYRVQKNGENDESCSISRKF